jgi:hypothetical protein
MAEVRNTKAMAVLLDALKLRSFEWDVNADKIVIHNDNDLRQAILSSEEELQHIYGNTEEWLELVSLFKINK